MGRAVVLGGAAQCLDEADQSGERRAQLVARVGDEVGAHLFGATPLGQVVERHQHGGTVGGGLGEWHDLDGEEAVHRVGHGEVHGALLLGAQRLVGGGQHARVAKRG